MEEDLKGNKENEFYILVADSGEKVSTSVTVEELSQESDEFEFMVVQQDDQLHPIYPIFNQSLICETLAEDWIPIRDLVIHDSEEIRSVASSSSSESDELDHIPADSYCTWTPKTKSKPQEMCKKSSSAGVSKSKRFIHLLRRSNSDGKEDYALPNETTIEKSKNQNDENFEKNEEKKNLEKKSKKKVSVHSAHESHYIRNRAIKEEDRRRSYLPYRIGIFA